MVDVVGRVVCAASDLCFAEQMPGFVADEGQWVRLAGHGGQGGGHGVQVGHAVGGGPGQLLAEALPEVVVAEAGA